MTKPVSPSLLLHRLLILLSWKHNSSILAEGQEKLSSLSPLTDSVFWEASKMASPKETATALKASYTHRPWITRNPWWSIHVLLRVSFDIHDFGLLPSSLFQERKSRRKQQTKLSTTWLPPVSPHLFSCECRDSTVFSDGWVILQLLMENSCPYSHT